MSRYLNWTVPPELAGIKVDTLLKRHLNLSGTVVRRIKWLEDGILVDGVRVNTRFVPRAGQVLSVRLSDPERRSGIVPAPGPLDLIYEDEDLVVLNKTPASLSTRVPATLTIQFVIFCSTITILSESRRMPTPSTGWTGGPPACWQWPSTPTPRRC